MAQRMKVRETIYGGYVVFDTEVDRICDGQYMHKRDAQASMRSLNRYKGDPWEEEGEWGSRCHRENRNRNQRHILVGT